MASSMSTQEQQLCHFLARMPIHFQYRYSEAAHREVLDSLFWSLAAGRPEYMRLFFPDGRMPPNLNLKEAQGAVEGAEYTEAARGKRCGHIFKAGEASYACRTCSTDDTCCLCSRCFEATDHTGHMVRVNLSIGNSGCCDCGDEEAWKGPLYCTIHSELDAGKHGDKGKASASLPEDLLVAMQMTVGRVFDYICDVISCSPEQLRQQKTKVSIQGDEQMSRLSLESYGYDDASDPAEYALLLWNDEKHTINDVQSHIARSCRTTEADAYQRALETDSVGRSILKYSANTDTILAMAKKLEEIRVTVTVRSARDTFREQMCASMVDWLSDISGCSVGNNHHALRHIICQEMLKPWRQGSPATHAIVGKDGMDDEELISEALDQENLSNHQILINFQRLARRQAAQLLPQRPLGLDDPEDSDDIDDDIDIVDDGRRTPASDEDEEEEEEEEDGDVLMVDAQPDAPDVEWRQPDQALEEDEATLAGYPPPPPPPPPPALPAVWPPADIPAAGPATTTPLAAPAVDPAGAGPAVASPTPVRRANRERERETTPSDSDTAEPLIAHAVYAKSSVEIPKTPGNQEKEPAAKPGRYWLETPADYLEHGVKSPAEDVFQRVRLDWLILFDLRMWKRVRNDLRALYISTVVQVPEFKRILGLRFASLYTTLAQLYLIGDREPDHSIINLSLQMLTTPSITAQLVERGNFLTCLFAILYTFLTTRQVGHPWDVSSTAVLAFDSGSVTNRRIYHFYMDLKYLLASPYVQDKIRTEPRYLMQFLDLVKLHQGIGPNIRAVGEHVEYETDGWIMASLVTREINRMSRQLSEAFRHCPTEEFGLLANAIRIAAKAVILNSIGSERHRFKQAEIKEEVRFKTVQDFEFDLEHPSHQVVKFVVEENHISFHHALHYTLSWLIECGKSMPADSLRALLSFTATQLKDKPRSMGRKTMSRHEYSAEDYLMAAFDFPLRVCAWLAQVKANMWVRNGISLRHQAVSYRGVNQRDIAHHRDIFLLQTALVTCDPDRVLASVIDRFGMEKWVQSIFEQKSEAQDDVQHLDVVEDMIHLLIVLLSDRTSLIPPSDEPNMSLLAVRRDLIHVLCFKPLSFNDICNKMPEKYQEQEDFHHVLDAMTTFKAPEGVSDVGTFELRPEYLEEVDPYIAHYNKNQREESEAAYRKHMAKKTGKPADEIVYEPKLRPITSGVFKDLAAFTGTGMFAQIIYYSLLYPLVAGKFTPSVPSTRIETFMQVVLHLILIAITEDRTDEDDMAEESPRSFIFIALMRMARSNFSPEAPHAKTIVALLEMMSTKEEFKSCHPRILLILRRMRQKRPRAFETAYHQLGVPVDRITTSSPAQNSADQERDRKKRAALSRQAQVMAQFQQQQKSFLKNQGDIDWGSDLEDEPSSPTTEDRTNTWKYPAGTCILCQEETDDRRLYGTFALINESRILRLTDMQDPDFVREAFQTPANLDRSAEEIRPFGVARENRRTVEKVNNHGDVFLAEKHDIGKGFPAANSLSGPVSVGCGHIMHYSCFQAYYDSTSRRHSHQIARHHPEDIKRKEFVCPLCKALGNAFLPIIWKGKEESHPGAAHSQVPFTGFLTAHMAHPHKGATSSTGTPQDDASSDLSSYVSSTLISSLADHTSAFVGEAWLRPGSSAQAPAPTTEFTATSVHNFPIPESNMRETSSSSSSSYPSDQADIVRELVAVYRRLRDTMRVNQLKSRHPQSNPKIDIADELCASDILSQAVAFSIAATEIQQRGVEAQYGMLFVEKVPDQALTHLRILAETTTSYRAIGGLRTGLENRVLSEFRKDANRQYCQLFVSQCMDKDKRTIGRPVDSYIPLLTLDPFTFLVDCSFGVSITEKMDISNLMRLCYLAEIVKVVVHLGRNVPFSVWVSQVMNPDRSANHTLSSFADFAYLITSWSHDFCTDHTETVDSKEKNSAFAQPGLDSLEGFYTFLKKYALTFLRKSALLLHVKYGVDLKTYCSTMPEAEELDRLTEALRLPSLQEMCAGLTSNGPVHGWPADATFDLVKGWVKHQCAWPRRPGARIPPALAEIPKSAVLVHPGIFELVGLPKNYDILIEEATRRKCPTTGKDLSDPMICLHCGEMFCGQSFCCLKEESVAGDSEKESIGGAQQHMRKCQRNVGVFINVRKCCIFYNFRNSGSWSVAPYIDKYGETDMGFRHNRQLYLNQKRYDTIRNTFLSHGVPSFISRKLESEINNGGWETI